MTKTVLRLIKDNEPIFILPITEKEKDNILQNIEEATLDKDNVINLVITDEDNAFRQLLEVIENSYILDVELRCDNIQQSFKLHTFIKLVGKAKIIDLIGLIEALMSKKGVEVKTFLTNKIVKTTITAGNLLNFELLPLLLINALKVFSSIATMTGEEYDSVIEKVLELIETEGNGQELTIVSDNKKTVILLNLDKGILITENKDEFSNKFIQVEKYLNNDKTIAIIKFLEDGSSE